MVQLIKDKFEKGQLIIELLIAFGLASILIPAVVLGFITGSSGRAQQQDRLTATGYLKEEEEAVRSLRDLDWSNVATNGTYHPVPGANSWSLNPGSETIGNFQRNIVISDVSPADPSKKLVTLNVSWMNVFPITLTNQIILSRWKNLTLSDTQQVIEEAGGFANWCIPSLSTTNVDLSRQGHATTVHAFQSDNGTGNRVFTGTGANSSGPAFSNLVIQGNSPPHLVSDTDYNGTPQIKANGVFGDTNYAFLATDSKGVEIVELATAPYQQIGSFNPQGMKPANSVYVVGNTGYVITDDKLYIFSISADRKTTSQIGVMNLANALKIKVDPAGQYAYVVTSDITGQLKVIDVHTNPATPTVYGHVAVNGGAGRDIYINDTFTRAYLATAASATQPEFFIIDISNPQNPTAIPGATYDTNGMDPQGVAIVTSNRAIIVGTGGVEYQVFTIQNDTVGFCPNHNQNNDSLNIDSGVYGVETVFQSDRHAYSYLVTGDANAELKIIEGGPGDNGTGGSGYFESATLPVPDPGHDVVFNSFSGTIDPNLSYKISIKHGVGGSCSGVTFADSDFTTYPPGPLPLGTLGAGYANPGECMRYRAYNSGTTPITYTITFNYSP